MSKPETSIKVFDKKTESNHRDVSRSKYIVGLFMTVHFNFSKGGQLRNIFNLKHLRLPCWIHRRQQQGGRGDLVLEEQCQVRDFRT